MPLRNVKGQWYWGSKGPFDTKAKALAVARAAYAHGYTGDKKENFSDSLVTEKNSQSEKK
jgi:hypothetical protein